MNCPRCDAPVKVVEGSTFEQYEPSRLAYDPPRTVSLALALQVIGYLRLIYERIPSVKTEEAGELIDKLAEVINDRE